jgi:hypothetical protein
MTLDLLDLLGLPRGETCISFCVNVKGELCFGWEVNR